jgi:hypothetical protein
MTAMWSFGNVVGYEITELITGQTGSIGLISIGALPNIPSLFNGTPQHYAGSLIQIRERLTIVTNINIPELVDVDYRWFSPRKYLGTYQLINNFGLIAGGIEEQGSLFHEIQHITRLSWYTIVAKSDVPIALGQQISIEDCNFFLVPGNTTFPGSTEITPGQRLAEQLTPNFIGNIGINKAPLVNQVLDQKISGVGLFLYAGVSGVRVDYKAEVVNTIAVDFQALPVPSCVFGVQATCNQQYNAFLIANNYHATQAECEAVNTGNICVKSVWFCPTDGTDQRDYWIANQGGGGGG